MCLKGIRYAISFVDAFTEPCNIVCTWFSIIMMLMCCILLVLYLLFCISLQIFFSSIFWFFHKDFFFTNIEKISIVISRFILVLIESFILTIEIGCERFGKRKFLLFRSENVENLRKIICHKNIKFSLKSESKSNPIFIAEKTNRFYDHFCLRQSFLFDSFTLFIELAIRSGFMYIYSSFFGNTSIKNMAHFFLFPEWIIVMSS